MKFLDGILSGKINKYNAEKEYVEKIKSDENLLRNFKDFAKNKNVQKIARIMSNLIVFGSLLPSDLEE